MEENQRIYIFRYMKYIGKNKILMLFIFPKYCWFWPYSPQNTKATVKCILRRNDAILRQDNSTNFDSIKNWGEILHIQEQKMCNIFSVTLSAYTMPFIRVLKVSIIYIPKSTLRHWKFAHGTIKTRFWQKMIWNLTFLGP